MTTIEKMTQLARETADDRDHRIIRRTEEMERAGCATWDDHVRARDAKRRLVDRRIARGER